MRLAAFFLALVFAWSFAGTPGGAAAQSPAPRAAVVPCSSIRDLRALGPHLSHVTNPVTGDTMEYTIVGDGASSSDVLVMFPGTGQLLTNWPVQMLTNSTYSPKIEHTVAYDAREDGPVSLCHDYRIALFDYPGVGATPMRHSVTRDMLSSDVDAMLNDASSRYGISTRVVDPLGWSLGTTNAEKYSVLSPVSNPARTIHNVILISAGPGASEQAQVGYDSAACVTTMFAALPAAHGWLRTKLETTLTKMIFPYVGQTQAESGTKSGCTAKISGSRLTLSVRPDCSTANHCLQFLADSILDMHAYPWRLTGGIDPAVLANERALSHDFNVAYCSGAARGFASTGCMTYAPAQMNVRNGGICRLDTGNPDVPVVTSCAPLEISGKLTVINGYQDLLTQWTYGKALVDAYARTLGKERAQLRTYPGAAGHGVMIQHPRWTQAQIFTAMQ